MYACAKFVSTPSLIRAGSRALYRPISATVLSRPEGRTREGSALLNGGHNPCTHLIVGYSRNPSLKQQLFSYAILGFALSEAIGLF
ncbi:hypothetical protein GDO78_005941 [Eleutherodactylus coqui]|uniref:Uncharacterized protein n=1 Tax=Eleutherodactylus coqui TaxID=57060 RepID=A0A8J6KG21_ELECQ|nr:hypothetical protein GDO78_005941 [Eleutherodactylus coqui]